MKDFHHIMNDPCATADEWRAFGLEPPPEELDEDRDDDQEAHLERRNQALRGVRVACEPSRRVRGGHVFSPVGGTRA